MCIIRKIIFLMMFIICVSLFAEKPKKMLFVGAKPLSNPVMGWLAAVQEEALNRLNIEFEFKQVPLKRASLFLNRGEYDGDLSRVAIYNTVYKNLIRVEEPVSITTLGAFSLNPNIHLEGWEDLSGTNYTVDYRYGIMIIEKKLSKYINEKKIQTSSTFEIGIKKLLRNRVDLYIGNIDEVYLAIENLEKKGEKFKDIYMVGIIEVTPNHIFLHKKHINLLPELSKVLKIMKKEGTFEKLRIQYKVPKEKVRWNEM